MPNFKSDLDQEIVLAKYLDKIYKDKKLDFRRVFELEKQYRGIDLIILFKSSEYLIDEKAQLHYINSDLPTFTFELSYLKNNSLKTGWLFDNEKVTQYYFLITGIYLKKNKKQLLSPNDVEKLKVTSVNRAKLINHLLSINLSKEILFQYDFMFRKLKSYGKNIISELDSKSEGLIYFTENLIEKPINLQLRLKYLIDIGVAKKFHYD